MNVQILPCRFPLKDQEWPKRMLAGIEASGDKAVIAQHYRKGFDCYMFWGLRRRHARQIIAAGEPFVCVERGYLGNRIKEWLMVGIGGLNGFANFNNDNVPGDRWELWKDQLLPWKGGGDYALIMGQVPGDMSLRGMDPYKWAEATAIEARKYYKKVYFRPHPDVGKARKVTNALMLLGDYNEAIDKSAVVITYSSNAAVDSVMRGTPAISTIRGSMAWDVTSHRIDQPLYRGDREAWGHRLAYAQWHIDEIKSGEAWRHIRGGL